MSKVSNPIHFGPINFGSILFGPILFIVINFVISAFSDICLNFLSRLKISPDSVQALKSYFNKQSILVSATYAGLTVIIVLIITMLMSKLVFNFFYPTTIKQLVLFLILAAPLGYIADAVIYYFQVFGDSLNEYYKKAGVGFWGSAAFVFSIIFSFLVVKIFL
jgi:hypothetical protein